MVFHVFRLAGLLILTNFTACTSQKLIEEIKKDRIKLTKFKKQIEKVYYIQNNYKNKVPVLIAKLKVATKPREKGKYVTRIQRLQKKLKRCKEKINILKTRIIELENQGITPL